MTKTKRSFFEKLTGTRRGDGLSISSEISRPVSFYEDDSLKESFMKVETTSAASSTTSPSFSHSQTPKMEEPRQQWEQESEEESDGQLTIDMYQTENDIIIKSTIAGVKPEDIDVSINDDTITIRGSRHMDEEIPEEKYYYQECYWGSFSRSVVLPVDVLSDKIEASLKNGILTIRLPRAEINKIKKIQVRGF